MRMYLRASTSTVLASQQAAPAGRSSSRRRSRCGRTGGRTRGSAWSPPPGWPRWGRWSPSSGRTACPARPPPRAPAPPPASCRSPRSAARSRPRNRCGGTCRAGTARCPGCRAGAGWQRRPRGRSPTAGRRATRRRTACCRRPSPRSAGGARGRCRCPRSCATPARETAVNRKFLSPSTSVRATWVPPKKSPLEVTPTFRGGRPSRNSFSNTFFRRLFSGTTWWVTSGWKSMISADATWTSCSTSFTGSRDLQGVELVLALEVADEADPRRAPAEERLGRGVAAQGVGVLADDRPSSGRCRAGCRCRRPRSRSRRSSPPSMEKTGALSS